MRKTVCRLITSVWAISLLQPLAACAQESKPVFELDCISFAGRFLGNAPLKKKVHPGLAVDGTVWSISPESKMPVIDRVIPGEAAQQAGVQPGDKVIAINGYPTAGKQLRDVFCFYHMYDPDKFTETLVIEKKDGSKDIFKLKLLSLDKCAADEKRSWLNIYKSLGY